MSIGSVQAVIRRSGSTTSPPRGSGAVVEQLSALRGQADALQMLGANA